MQNSLKTSQSNSTNTQNDTQPHIVYNYTHTSCPYNIVLMHQIYEWNLRQCKTLKRVERSKKNRQAEKKMNQASKNCSSPFTLSYGLFFVSATLSLQCYFKLLLSAPVSVCVCVSHFVCLDVLSIFSRSMESNSLQPNCKLIEHLIEPTITMPEWIENIMMTTTTLSTLPTATTNLQQVFKVIHSVFIGELQYEETW